jgi:hypothetical protein
MSRPTKAELGAWIGGLATWTEEETRTAFLSIAFTWKIPEARRWAIYYGQIGYKVVAGGPALFLPKMRALLADVAETPLVWRMIDGRLKQVPAPKKDVVIRHNPMATKASDGCDQGCSFCIVTALEGKEYTLYPDFPVRPVLTDNNLSGLPAEYQQHIVDRYLAAGVRLADANSGFEPHTFDGEVFERWKAINDGPWRFAFDDLQESQEVDRVFDMLDRNNVPAKKRRVYVLIGNEPFEACMERIQRVIERGGEPHVQPYMKLNALKRRPHARFDWTVQRLVDVARWANGWVWRTTPFEEYDRSIKKPRPLRYRAVDGLFI